MIAQLLKKLPGKCEENKPLAEMVAYKIGGPARYFYTPQGSGDLLALLKDTHKLGIPLFILGSGTNLLISDSGFDGIVLWLGPSFEEKESEIKILSEDAREVVLRVPSHYSKAGLLDYSLRRQWAGLEFSSGIPGSLGGAVFMNAGTKWGSYGEVITEVEFVSSSRGVYSLKTDEIGFKYRGHGEGLLDGHTVVSSVTLKLRKDKDFADVLKTVDEIYSYRGLRQPLELPNCGSVFKNPANSERGAGRLIEAAGLKGARVGQAEVSQKHANFILNCGDAKARDVHELIRRIQAEVHAKFQIELEPEVIFVGKF